MLSCESDVGGFARLIKVKMTNIGIRKYKHENAPLVKFRKISLFARGLYR